VTKNTKIAPKGGFLFPLSFLREGLGESLLILKLHPNPPLEEEEGIKMAKISHFYPLTKVLKCAIIFS